MNLLFRLPRRKKLWALLGVPVLLASMFAFVGEAQASGAPWPGASTTGVPSTTTLTTYGGSCTITAANTTIDSKTVNCTLNVQAANFTLIRSKVNGQVWLDNDLTGADNWSMTITDSEVDPGEVQQPAICCGNLTALRVDAHGGQTAMQCEEKSLVCNVTDSYLHGQRIPDHANWHLGGFLSDGTRGSGCTGTWCINLEHNYIVCDHVINLDDEGCTGDANFIPNFAQIKNVRLNDNFFGAAPDGSDAGNEPDAAYCTYGGDKVGSDWPDAEKIQYTNNVFEHGSNNMCAAYGPVTNMDVGGTNNIFDTTNHWDYMRVVPEN